MIDLRILCKLSGGLLVIMATLICVPAVFAFFHDPSVTPVYLALAVCSGVFGALLYSPFQNYTTELNHRTGFAVVACAWIFACSFGALPYYLTGTFTSFIDAFFESVSGFSGTGASVLTTIEDQSKVILLWRSLTQWIGGMGIIVFFIAILPMLGLGGVQLFKAEITGPEKDKITPRVQDTAKKLWLLYVSFTLAAVFSLMLCGLGGYDAVNHALTTISTGGFSTKNVGVAAYNSIPVELVISLFMLVSSINFSLHYRFLALRDRDALKSTELKWYIGILALATLLVTYATYGESYTEFAIAFQKALFTVVCTASSTGFTNVDYTVWSSGAQSVLVLLMIFGGMSGSTAGGAKCIRIVAATKQLIRELKQVVHPSAVYTIKTNAHSIAPNIVNAIWGFLFLYLFFVALLTVALCFQGLDLVTSSTATISVLSNIGPALGELGPYANYSELTDVAKLLLSAGMLLGRLEFYTILIIFLPVYWQR